MRLVVALGLAALPLGARAANLTSFVNLFIGTASGANGGSGGNAYVLRWAMAPFDSCRFPGSAVPHAMAKVRRSL